ncbi:hypothetical protein B0H13DRAFT_2381727 [Mycena leptocephala]|nr:hypothetical protein B0H13DRAFT_2381727 [Mycena leptocephala]
MPLKRHSRKGNKVQDLIRQRQSARQQHVANFETLFHPIIKTMREHASPYANQKCRREMDESVFYTAEVVQLPSGKRQWDEYAFEIQQERGYTWAIMKK